MSATSGDAALCVACAHCRGPHWTNTTHARSTVWVAIFLDWLRASGSPWRAARRAPPSGTFSCTAAMSGATLMVHVRRIVAAVRCACEGLGLCLRAARHFDGVGFWLVRSSARRRRGAAAARSAGADAVHFGGRPMCLPGLKSVGWCLLFLFALDPFGEVAACAAALLQCYQKTHSLTHSTERLIDAAHARKRLRPAIPTVLTRAR